MPAEHKSAIRKWYDSQIASGDNKVALAKLHVKAAGEGLRAGGEALLVGGALGAMHAYLPGGLDYKRVPMDATVGMIFLASGTLGAQHEAGKDLANAGATCLGIFAFRKTNDLIVEMRKSGTKIGKASFGFEREPGTSWGHTSGPSTIDEDEDPIIAAARALI
jgi:hypothetical protein